MSTAGVRAVFFDAVGTLLHPQPPAAEVYARVGKQYGSRLTVAEVRTRFRAAFQHQEALDRDNLLQTSEEREYVRWQRIVAAVLDDVTDRDVCFQELFAHFGRPEAWHLEADAAFTLQELAGRGFVLGLASNYDRRLRDVVAGLPALRPLRHLVISSEVGWRKPAAPFFAAVCHDTGLATGTILFVGDDRVNDYAGSRAAGFQAVLFDPHVRYDEQDVRRITRLTELLTAVDG